MRDGESQIQARHVSQIVKYGGGAMFMCGCMTPRDMGHMCKVEVEMTQALYLSILQGGAMKRIEWYRFNPSSVMFQHDNVPNYIAKLVKH